MIVIRMIAIVWLFVSCAETFAQEKEIVKILNRELRRECDRQLKSPDFNGDTVVIIQPYKIEGRVLSVIIRKNSDVRNGYYCEKQEVPLGRISAIAKDVNILFEASSDAVRIEQTTQSGEVSESRNNLFFLHFSCGKNNEYIADELIKAFRKSGMNICKSSWYD